MAARKTSDPRGKMAAMVMTNTTGRSSTVCGRHHGQAVVASIALASPFLERCVLMLRLELGYLARFSHDEMFWASFACFFDPLGPKNIFKSHGWAL